jgi:hypothetical protein
MFSWNFLLAAVERGAMSGIEQLLLFVPLVLISSLVYGVTRHESWPVIFREAARMAVWFGFFTGCMFIVVLLLSQFN